MTPRRLLIPLALAAALACPSAASATGVFPGEVIDGPTADLVSVGDVDLARDGTGAVVYVKKDGGVNHIFVSRLADGVFQGAERVDQGLNDAGAQPAVAAGDGGRLAIAFVSGGSLYAVVVPTGGGALPAPQPLGSPAATPSVDMSINGAAYIVYTSGGDVRAAHLDRTATAFSELGAVLDLDGGQPAGDTAVGRPHLARCAPGVGLATWAERGADGHNHVIARRLFNASISTSAQDITLSDYQGHSAGDADSPDVDIEDDSSFAWIAFRQTLDGTPRAVARRLVGGEFEPPSLIDPLGFPTPEGIDDPALDLNGTGAGLAAEGSSATHQVYVSPLQDDAFGKGSTRVDSAANAIPPRPLTGIAQSGDGFVTWLQAAGTGAPAGLLVRLFDDKAGFAPETSLTNPDLGPIDTTAGYDASVDRVNDGAAVAIQGTGADRRLVAGMIDREPGAFVGTTTQKIRRFQGLRWSPAFDLWGKLTYTVLLDNKPAGTTQATNWLPQQGVPDGIHRWRVIATDRRGQTKGTATRLLRVDNTPPDLDVRISGTRKAGKLLKFRFSAGDVQNPGASGLHQIRVVWGDGRSGLSGKSALHRYRRGRYTLRVSATDKAGNFTVVRKRLVIRK